MRSYYDQNTALKTLKNLKRLSTQVYKKKKKGTNGGGVSSRRNEETENKVEGGGIKCSKPVQSLSDLKKCKGARMTHWLLVKRLVEKTDKT